MNEYTARQTPDGRCFVLHPDGLSWEPPVFEELAAAERHADELNKWLDAKPTGEGPVMIHESFDVKLVIDGPVPPSQARLLAAIDRIFRPDRQLDSLAASLGLS